MHHVMDAETFAADPSMTPKDQAINSVLLTVKMETSESSISDPDEESISTVSSKTLLLPRDWCRWKTTKSAEKARAEITKTLRQLDLGHNEDNWNKWERYFIMLVNSLELSDFIFDGMRAPTTRTELQNALAGGDASRFDSDVLPQLFRDEVGKIFQRKNVGSIQI